MAESRREKKDSCDFPFFALAVPPMLRSPASWLGGDAGPWFQGNAGPWFRGIAGSLVSGQCRPLDPGNAGPWFQGNAGSWIRAFILTASKSRINDETPLNSCTLQGRSSLFREIAVLG